MKILKTTVLIAACLGAGSVMAAGEKDCLLQGTVVRGDQAGQEMTMVKIHSVSRYDEQSRCKVRSGKKMEFKLPQDTRVQSAPEGSEVKYRYRSDDNGSNAELISIGA